MYIKLSDSMVWFPLTSRGGITEHPHHHYVFRKKEKKEEETTVFMQVAKSDIISVTYAIGNEPSKLVY